MDIYLNGLIPACRKLCRLTWSTHPRTLGEVLVASESDRAECFPDQEDY